MTNYLDFEIDKFFIISRDSVGKQYAIGIPLSIETENGKKGIYLEGLSEMVEKSFSLKETKIEIPLQYCVNNENLEKNDNGFRKFNIFREIGQVMYTDFFPFSKLKLVK